jgi:pantoate--beta-alanine ligase
MILFKKSRQLSQYLEDQWAKDFKIGFCPTMGALHPGHISLINAAKKANAVTVASIFVNPAQFNDPKDFEKYPVTIERDIDMLEEAGCNILFMPSVNEMYPEGYKTNRQYDLGRLETILEGKYRPGHYQGVCLVVEKLLNIINPDNLYLGQKDYQQCMVIKKLIELMEADKKIKITVCPTLREKEGLAMSSRNIRLTEDERKTAQTIFKTLSYIKENFHTGQFEHLKQKARLLLEQKGFRVDYVEIADAENLTPISNPGRQPQAVALIAAYLNEIRLIDNLLIQ